jgi:hypothetical protein
MGTLRFAHPTNLQTLLREEAMNNSAIWSWLNTALTVNFFFVLASFAWFLIAVVGRSLEIPLGFELWYRLWQPLFQPAIGLLMLGAIINGVGSWLQQKLKTWRNPNNLLD